MATTKSQLSAAADLVRARLELGIGLAPRPGFEATVIQTHVTDMLADLDTLDTLIGSVNNIGGPRTEALTVADSATAALV